MNALFYGLSKAFLLLTNLSLTFLISAQNSLEVYSESNYEPNTNKTTFLVAQEEPTQEFYKPEYDLHLANEKLEKMYNCLRLFIKGSDFDFDKYGLLQKRLAQELEKIEVLVRYLQEDNQRSDFELLRKYFFSKYMHLEMAAASKTMLEFRHHSQLERHYISTLLNLYFMLFSFQTNEGLLDMNTTNVELKIILAWRDLSLLTLDIRDLPEMSKEVYQLFEKQILKVEEVVDRLWSQIPDAMRIHS